jgi:hypothetical protein
MKLTKARKREYILFFLGKHPQNLKHGIKAVIDSDSYVGVSIGQSVVIVRFTSTKKIQGIRKIFNRVFKGYVDSYMLFKVNKNNFVKELYEAQNNHLYNVQNTADVVLDKMENYIMSVNGLKSDMANFVHQQIQLIREAALLDNNNTPNTQEERIITMDEINPILEKINKYGINSLTEGEKNTLKQYAKNS